MSLADDAICKLEDLLAERRQELDALRNGYDTVMLSLQDAEAALAALRSACQALALEMLEWCDPNGNVPDGDDELTLVTRWAEQLAALARVAPGAERT